MTFAAKVRQELLPFKDRADRQTVVILLSASVLLTVFRYYGSSRFFDNHLAQYVRNAAAAPQLRTLYSFCAAALLMLVVPMVVIKALLKKKVSDFGWQVGDWRLGLALVGILLPLTAAILLWPAAHDAAFRAEYPLFHAAGKTLSFFSLYAMIYGLYYLGWEFFFRGFMLFGLRDAVGPLNSILISTIPSTLMHIGKPDSEIFAAMIAGILFGAIALRTRSILYVFLLHWLIGVTLDCFIIMTPGGAG